LLGWYTKIDKNGIKIKIYFSKLITVYADSVLNEIVCNNNLFIFAPTNSKAG